MSDHKLSTAEIHSISSAYAELEILTSERPEKPVAVMLVGQPGTGRHAMINEVSAQLNQQGGYVSAKQRDRAKAPSVLQRTGSRKRWRRCSNAT